jgi:peptidoglycan/xylan/chitin deacetylase (PgdA/CDA1 family)
MSTQRSALVAIALAVAALAGGCHDARKSSSPARTTSRSAASPQRAQPRPAVAQPRPQTPLRHARPTHRVFFKGQIPDRLPTSRRVVALTFDAGANDAGAAEILATLRESGATGTFFLTGRWAQLYPQWARRIAARYPIGNHTFDHSDLTRLTPPAVRREVQMASAAIRRITGRPSTPIFRFPYGASSPSTLRTANQLGYTAVGWTVDTLGWEGTSLGQSTQSVVSHALARLQPGEIILMHVGSNPNDHSTLDADALRTIIQDIRQRGYTLVTLQLLAPSVSK